MNKVIRNTSWMCAGLLLSLVSGTPALADDTELLLVDPNKSSCSKRACRWANERSCQLMFTVHAHIQPGRIVQARRPMLLG